MPSRLYLDNAATSFPKPPQVWEAALRYATTLGASPGRGQYLESREGARLIRQCRERISDFLNLGSPDHVIFTLNTSDALNLAIKGFARAHRMQGHAEPLRLVTSAMDHNSVLRPFAALEDEGAIVTHVPADAATGEVSLEHLDAALSRGAHLLALNWVSNVTGTIQPIERATALAHTRGVPVLLDIAQGAGHLPFDMRAVGADMVACPGHKGLLGPQGTGILAIRPGFEQHLATTREGGTGSISELDAQPTTMPERFEAGSHNTVGIVGLSEGVRYLSERTMPAVRAHELALITRFIDGLREGGAALEGEPPAHGPLAPLRLLGPADPRRRVGVFSLTHDEMTPAELAAVLEQEFAILARAGIHCAPRAHETAGTLDYTLAGNIPARGALRLSLGPFNTEADIDRVLDALLALGAPSLGTPSLREDGPQAPASPAGRNA